MDSSDIGRYLTTHTRNKKWKDSRWQFHFFNALYERVVYGSGRDVLEKEHRLTEGELASLVALTTGRITHRVTFVSLAEPIAAPVWMERSSVDAYRKKGLWYDLDQAVTRGNAYPMYLFRNMLAGANEEPIKKALSGEKQFAAIEAALDEMLFKELRPKLKEKIGFSPGPFAFPTDQHAAQYAENVFDKLVFDGLKLAVTYLCAWFIAGDEKKVETMQTLLSLYPRCILVGIHSLPAPSGKESMIALVH